MFRGVQTASVDAKYRLKFPALARKRLDEEYSSSDVFITSLNGKDVKIFPLKEWETVESRLSEKSDHGKQKNDLLFLANHFGADESLDNQGRILVPGTLREGSGMRGEVKMVWQSNHILVLSAERYQEKLAQTTTVDESVVELAESFGL